MVQLLLALMSQPLTHLTGSYLSINSAVEAAEHLDEDLHRVGAENLLFLSANHGLMLIPCKFAIGYLRQLLHNLLADVLLAHVTVVVDEDFQQHHRVLADLVEDVQDEVLVVVACVARVQQLQEDSLKEHFNDVLEVLAEVAEQAEENRDNQTEDLALIGHTVSK